MTWWFHCEFVWLPATEKKNRNKNAQIRFHYLVELVWPYNNPQESEYTKNQVLRRNIHFTSLRSIKEKCRIFNIILNLCNDGAYPEPIHSVKHNNTVSTDTALLKISHVAEHFQEFNSIPFKNKQTNSYISSNSQAHHHYTEHTGYLFYLTNCHYHFLSPHLSHRP